MTPQDNRDFADGELMRDLGFSEALRSCDAPDCLPYVCNSVHLSHYAICRRVKRAVAPSGTMIATANFRMCRFIAGLGITAT